MRRFPSISARHRLFSLPSRADVDATLKQQNFDLPQ
jgi:hypothetical protein